MTPPPASHAAPPSADTSVRRDATGPPSDAVTLSDLIVESGPLPVDAALECLERLAHRLENRPGPARVLLDPGNIFVDDNGDVWLPGSEISRETDRSATNRPSGEALHSLGRLLLHISTNGGRNANGTARQPTVELPWPIARLAGRLASGSRADFSSYANLAAEAARLRNAADETVDDGHPSAHESPHAPAASPETRPDSSRPNDIPSPDAEAPPDEAASLGVGESMPVETMVPPDLDGREAPPAAGDPQEASRLGRLAWWIVGLLVIAGIVLAFWWIGT